ncbi:MAG: putative ABC transporter ATP-binding protein YbiT [Chlamydiae bacterium]|nr:putative ABC transporter ATP-binding protein YbiT [Chlamydiota bacterium]
MGYGERFLFKDVTLHFNKRRRYGLVGANGSGKTTFLKILSGDLKPTSGAVQIPKDASVGILDQDYFRFGETPILELVLMGDKPLWEAFKRKESLLSKPSMSEDEMETLSEIESFLAMCGGYRAEAKAAQILNGLGIENSRHQMVLSTLSGGYKLRVLLSQVLFVQPDLLLLDEPTNYLDIFSIRWLERYLMDYPGTLILSSHDRYFLNRVCQEIVDIDYAEMRRYRGDFDQFMDKKVKEMEMKGAMLASYAKRKKDINRFIDRFKAKASKARQAGSRVRMIAKLEEEERTYEQQPSSREYPHFHFEIERPSGERVLSVEEISKSFSELQILKNIGFEVERGERVALVGANGIGKSTLLEILTGHAKADSGKYKWGVHAKLAYFPQNFHRLLNPEANVYDWLRAVSKEVTDEAVRRNLGQMLFDEEGQRKKIRALSGGEAARLVFASLMLKEHNILILDEPTNHLDIESTDALIEALNSYRGTLVMVSHNRYFISETANRIVELQGGKVVDFRGGYSEFVKQHERDYLDRDSARTKEKKSGGDDRRQRSRLKREVERLEREITAVEVQLHALNETLAAPHFYEKTSEEKKQKILNEQVILEEKREELYRKWESSQEK